MNSTLVSQRSLPFLLLLAFCLHAGCSGSGNPESMIAAANDSNIKRLATLYTFFQNKNRFRGPKDEVEFKEFISKQDPSRLALADINFEDVDSLFESERDGQPLIVRYGVNTVVRGPSLPVIFEAQGLDGMYQVGFTNGSMKEVDQAEYERLKSGQADGRRPDDQMRRQE